MSDFPKDYPLDEVHPGDCVELLKKVPDESAQLVIADPPYNLGPTFGVEKEWVRDEEWLPWCGEWLAECKRILRPDGNLLVYGIHHYLCYIQVHLYEIGLQYRRQIIWHYENGFSTYRRSLAAHYEPILWFSKTDDYYFREIRELLYAAAEANTIPRARANRDKRLRELKARIVRILPRIEEAGQALQSVR